MGKRENEWKEERKGKVEEIFYCSFSQKVAETAES